MSETSEETKQNVATDSDKSLLIDSEGKNSKSLSCNYCDCLLLRPNIAIFVEMQKELPSVMVRSSTETSVEVLKEFWCVSDMFQFENMAFSKNVDTIKYLACAECDLGPIGWHNLCDKKCYIALNRIKHQ